MCQHVGFQKDEVIHKTIIYFDMTTFVCHYYMFI